MLFFICRNFAPYLISYLRNRTDDVNLRNVDGLWIGSTGSIVNCIGMSVGGMLEKKFGPRILQEPYYSGLSYACTFIPSQYGPLYSHYQQQSVCQHIIYITNYTTSR